MMFKSVYIYNCPISIDLGSKSNKYLTIENIFISDTIKGCATVII